MNDLNYLTNVHRSEIEGIAAQAGVDFSQVTSLPHQGKVDHVKAIDPAYKGRVTIFVNPKTRPDGSSYHVLAFVNASTSVENTSWSSFGKTEERIPKPPKPKLELVDKPTVQDTPTKSSDKWLEPISIHSLGVRMPREWVFQDTLNEISSLQYDPDRTRLKSILAKLAHLSHGLLSLDELIDKVSKLITYPESKLRNYLTAIFNRIEAPDQNARKAAEAKRYKELYESAPSEISECPVTYFHDKKIPEALQHPEVKLLCDRLGPFLAFPLYDLKGEYVGLQKIYQKKNKQKKKNNHKFMTPAAFPGQFNGAHFVIGSLNGDSPTIYMTEGFATAYSIHLATGAPVVVALNANNLVHVTKHFRAKYPEQQILIAADNDIKPEESTAPNTGVYMALEAARAFSRINIVVPPSKDGQKIDWNDIHVKEGLDALNDQITAKENFLTVPKTRLRFLIALLPYAPASKLESITQEITKLSGAPYLISQEDLVSMLHEAITVHGKTYPRKLISEYVHNQVAYQAKIASTLASIKPSLVDNYLQVETVLNHEGHATIPEEVVQLVSSLHDTICIVRSPMGTSKTEVLMKQVLNSVDKGVYAAPRQSLVGDAARRLGMDHYQGIDGIEAAHSSKLALCINSIGSDKFKQAMYDLDVFCLDEAIQALPQITALGRDSAKKDNYDALAQTLNTAKLTLICDATANEFLVQQLRKIAPQKTICLIDVKNPNPLPWDIQFTPETNTARNTALEAVQKGKKLLVATDSKREAQSLELLLLHHQPGLNILNIHREPSELKKEAIKSFTNDPNQMCTQYDVVIYSPAITSGLSINTKHFECHVGIFFGVVTPMDILQMMGRDRTSQKWCLCIQDRNRHLQKISLAEAEKGLAQIAGNISDFDRLKLATDLYHNKSRENILTRTLHILAQAGHNITPMMSLTDSKNSRLGIMMNQIKDQLQKKRYELIQNQEIVSDEAYEVLNRDVLLTQEDKAKIDAYRIDKVLRSEVNESSIRFYDGHGISKLKLHEALQSQIKENGASIRQFDNDELQIEASLRFHAQKKAECIEKTLQILGVSTMDFTGEFNHEDCQKVIDYWYHDDRRDAFNSLGLGLLSTKNPPRCATSWLRKFLTKLGLRLDKRKSHGRMIRFIDPSSWKEVKTYLDARKAHGDQFFSSSCLQIAV